jgi:hypothetical protein
MRNMLLALLLGLGAVSTMAAPASALRPFDQCVAHCMRRGCNQQNMEGQQCMLDRRPGCVSECRNKQRW